MTSLSRGARLLRARLLQSMIESAHYSKYNAPMVGLLGVIGFPLYYYIWQYAFPQPYESLPLRLSAATLCAPLIFYKHWPQAWQHYFPTYWLVALTYSLPFVFTYMLLRNELSLVWSMSTMAALFLLVLAVYDWLLVVIISILGTTLAWITFWLTADADVIYISYLEQLPIYSFVILAGSVFNYTAQMVKEEKLEAYSSVGRNIAHELRTPLLGIRGAMAGISHYLPELLDAHEKAYKAGLPVKRIRSSRFEKLRSAADRVEDEITYSNTIIDMLLLSAGQTTLRKTEFAIYSCNKSILQALERYPFNSDRERQLVHWDQGDDFEYFGSDLLVNHVLFNLIKNALHSVLSSRKGEVRISTEIGTDHRKIIVLDTGSGIDNGEVRHIFEHFYTSKSLGQGTGIGLSFCRLAMESFSGSIYCRSVNGEYTEFTLKFPGIPQ